METEIRKVVSDGDMKKRETSPDALLTRDNFGHVKSLPRLQDLLFVDNLLSADAEETKDPLSSNSVKVSEEDTAFYTDKAVTELELPEFMVCFKEFEDDCRVVKDICIDDGHPSVSTILVLDGEICDESFSSVQSELDENGDFTEETMENTTPVLNVTNPFVECDDKPDLACESGREIVGGNSEGYIEETENVENEASIFNVTNPWVEFDSERVIPEKFNSQSLIENEDVDTETPVLNSTNPFLESDSEADVATKAEYESSIGDHQVDLDDILDVVSNEKTAPETTVLEEELDVSRSLEPSNADQNEDQQQSNQGISEEQHSVESMTPAATEESNTCEEPKTEPSESADITSDIDSALPETSGREDEDPSETIDPPKSVETINMPSIDEETADIRSASNRSFFIQHGFGESSFSATGPLSGPLQIPYSGSISLRSDSSTTSTRSFAFPVLNTEWSTSPVRMAKPDRSQFRKHRGWRMALLCCRF
ncbi:hypothetical protein ACHQM5_006733 [Ranunculus cassubicifolius]